VAAVNPELPAASGVRSYVFTLARELVSLGAQVSVLGYGHKGLDGAAFEFVSVADYVTTAPQYTLALARFVKNNRDLDGLVHANRPDDLLPFHLAAPNVQTIVTLHGVHGIHVRAKRGRLAATAYQLAERYSLHRARAILCVSPNTLAYFTSKYPNVTRRLRIVPAGVDMDLFRIRSRKDARAMFQLPEGGKVVAFVGRFEPEKNPELVAKEFLWLSERHADAYLVMVGAGRLMSEIRSLVHSLGERIIIFEPMAQENLAWLLSAVDVLVIGSWTEGLPTIAIEALASGIPLVATSVGILPMLVKNGMNGFLAEGSQHLGTLMEKALYDVDWSSEGCRASVAMFGWDRIAPAILEVYREILA